jgi:hypothetical protein
MIIGSFVESLLGGVGLGWIGLGWIGLDWVGWLMCV